MHEVLKTSFFDRPTLVVARELLGKDLVRILPSGEVVRMMVNEVEAYDGPEDRACHAFRGRTKRTDVMFGPAGRIYVYFVYGMHWMLNIVTGPKNYPAAILLRGAGDIVGPARLTKALSIDGTLNCLPADAETGLWFEDASRQIDLSSILATPRIGVDYAGKEWAEKPYRFVLKNE